MTGAASFQQLSFDDPDWASFLDKRSDATPFHHPSWARTLTDTYGFTGFAAVVRDGGGAIAAGLPVLEIARFRRRRWVGLPFTDACGPLGEPQAAESLVRSLDGRARAAAVSALEIRARVDGSPLVAFARGVAHELDLRGGFEAVSRGFGSQARRGVARAEREGVVVWAGQTSRDLEIFYRLHLLTRRRQGVPIQPRRFFGCLWEHVLAPGNGFLLIAEHRGRPAAAALFLTAYDTLVYKFGASDPRLLEARPNHALFAQAIRDGIDSGCRTLDFGRSDQQNRGLRTFKAGWGAIERELVYSAWTAPSGSGGPLRNVLAATIRRSPTWVCHAAGEALYRYTA